MMKTKQCTKCGYLKEVKEYHKNKKTQDGYSYHCKSCRKEESLKQYNLTLETYDALLNKQGGVCAICSTDDPRGQSKAGRFYVDHNHKTGEVRGLLCHDCNTALGLFKDNPNLLYLANKYLTERGNYG